MESKIVVSVCKTGSGYSAHIEALPGVIASGGDFEEVKKNMREAVEFHFEGMKEDGEIVPEDLSNIDLVFKMDVESLLHYFQGVLTQTAISNLTGINVKQLNHYAKGKSKPRAAQINKIEAGLHKLGNELIQIQL